MDNIANIEYFYLRCNKIFNTAYTQDDWGGSEIIDRAINIEWLCLALQKVYKKIHEPKHTDWDDGGAFKRISNSFKENEKQTIVNTELVDAIFDYISAANFAQKCWVDCACSTDMNCNCVCTPSSNGNCNCGGSGGACASACACNCNCECDCGRDSECVCDCTPQTKYECNCEVIQNCNCYPTRRATENCACHCQCTCDCDCWSEYSDYTDHSDTGGGGGWIEAWGEQQWDETCPYTDNWHDVWADWRDNGGTHSDYTDSGHNDVVECPQWERQ